MSALGATVRGTVLYRGKVWVAFLDPDTGEVYRDVGLYVRRLSNVHPAKGPVALSFKADRP